MSATVSVTVNGTKYDVQDVEPRMLLSDFLRDTLGLTGTHVGCEHGVCGACTVLVNGDSIRSCLMLAVQANGAEITTVEGLGTPETLNVLQAQFREHHGLQCGFCTPGMLMTGEDLLRKYPLATDDEIREGLSGNLCRCTGYQNIVAAIRAAAGKRAEKSIYVSGADRSETIDLPVSSALIRHKQGNVLFDTGCHPSVVDHAEARWGTLAKVMKPLMGANETLLPSLACVGMEPGDIDIVVNSHFHPDHCGCNQFFRKATILAHAKEIEAAQAPGAEAAGYLRADWDYGQPIEALNGERDLFDDGSVVLVPLPGHTPGTLGALVGLDRDGQFLLASDSVSLRQNLDADTAPRNTWNVDEQLKTFAEVRRIERAGATVICGHDDQQWKSLRKGSEGYE